MTRPTRSAEPSCAIHAPAAPRGTSSRTPWSTTSGRCSVGSAMPSATVSWPPRSPPTTRPVSPPPSTWRSAPRRWTRSCGRSTTARSRSASWATGSCTAATIPPASWRRWPRRRGSPPSTAPTASASPGSSSSSTARSTAAPRRCSSRTPTARTAGRSGTTSRCGGSFSPPTPPGCRLRATRSATPRCAALSTPWCWRPR